MYIISVPMEFRNVYQKCSAVYTFSGGGNIVLTNPHPDVEGVNSDRGAISKSKLTPDPFMLSKYLSSS